MDRRRLTLVGRPGHPLRGFGLRAGPAFLAAGSLAWWRGNLWAAVPLLVLGVFFLVGALVAPRALRVPEAALARVARALVAAVSCVLLTVCFALVITPAGLLLRLFGRSPFRTPSPRTTWSPYPARRSNPMHYERLF